MLKVMTWIHGGICAVVALTAAGCAKAPSAAASAGPPAAPVKVATAERRTLPVELRTIGNVEAYRTISVKSQVTGLLIQVHFKEGEPVRAGQLLFEIDPRPFQQAIQQIEANLARDRSQLALAEANLARDTAQEKFARDQARRYEELAKQGVFSPRKDYNDFLRGDIKRLVNKFAYQKTTLHSQVWRMLYEQLEKQTGFASLTRCRPTSIKG